MIYGLIQRFLRSFVTCHVSRVTCHSSLVTRHSSLVTRHLSFFVLLLLLPTFLFAQLSAGPPITINPGVPVTLTAKYGEDWVATPVQLNDDDVKGPFALDPANDFDFLFYGNLYKSFSIGSNGWISFTYNPNWGGTRKAISIPSNAPNSPLNCILGPMQDYNPEAPQSPYVYYKTIGSKPSRKLVVMWCQTPITWCMNDVVTFQIVLNELDNSIESHVYSKPSCTDPTNDKATLGIQNEYGTIALSPGYNVSALPLSEQAWKYEIDPNVFSGYKVTSINFELLPITPEDKISYAWYQGSELISSEKSLIVTPDVTTTYTAWCTICNGATFSSTVTVTVVPLVPDAFTPNNDMFNDTFDILGLPPSSIADYHIEIYNRWGQQVFMETDITKPWNGKVNNGGEICPDGVYVWVIYYLKADKTKVSNKGTVTLLR